MATNGNEKTNYSLKDLKKSQDDKKLFGICGGLGKHTPLPSWLWRAIFITAIFAKGLGLIAYIILIFLMPKETVVTVENPVVAPTNPSN